MAKYLSDIVDYLFEQQQEGFNTIDTTALDALILEFIETEENGYMTHTESQWDADSTSYINVLVDSTAASITVLEWKELYLEEVYNQSFIQNNQIAIRDSRSPNYVLVDFRDTLFDFDTNESINYAIDSTSVEVFLEYEYPTAVKIDGTFFQGGEDGIDAMNMIVIHAYLGYSNDGETFSYLKNQGSGIATSASTQQDAIDNPFIFDEPTGFASDIVSNIVFTKAIEAKYWRFYMVNIGSGYTAAVSHLRFQQQKTHGSQLVIGSVAGESITDRGIGGIQIELGCITEAHLADFAIGNIKLQTNSVSTIKIQDLAVTGPKIANEVTTSKHYSMSESVAGSSTEYKTLTIPNDTGRIPITSYWYISFRDNYATAANSMYLQLRKADGTWYDLFSNTSLYTAWAYDQAAFGEDKRTPANTARTWRFKMVNLHVAAVTFYANVDMIGTFVGNQNTHF